jgi:hypothetical protein
LSRRRSIPCLAAGFAFVITPPPVLNFVTPPFPSLLRRWFCLRHRAPASSAYVVAPPLPSLSCRCCFLHRAVARFIVTPPLYFFLTSSHVPVRYRILLSLLLSPAKALLSCHHCLPHPAADFILKSPLSTLSHHLSLHHHAASSAFLLALTLLSSSHCFRHCATAPFIVAPSLPSSLRRQFCLCRRATAAFFVMPPFHSLLCCQFCLCVAPPVLNTSSLE